MDIFGILGSIAPTLGKAISGDMGGAVNEALKAFGIQSGNKDDLEKALKAATPEQLAELKKLDLDYQKRLAELDIDLEKIYAEDKASARNMYIQTKDRLVPVLASLLILGAFLITGALFYVQIPPENKDTLFMVLGIVIGYTGNVVTFYFGSSNGSQKKNEIISKMSNLKT